MSRLKTEYGTNGQAMTITLGGLASAAARESSAIDNRTDRFLDVLVQCKFKTNASAPTGDKAVYVYAYGTCDDGTTYADVVTGSDAAITLTNPTNLRLLGIVNCPAASTTYKGEPWSLASVFGGQVPAFWGVVVVNATGNALDATNGNHTVRYQGLRQELVT